MNHQRIIACRMCKAPLDEPMLDFGEIAVGGIYLTAETLADEPRAPLAVHRCPECGLVQLGATMDEHYYKQYMFSGGHVAAYKRYIEHVAEIVTALGVGVGDTVIEAGSNDGSFLAMMADAGARGVGFEPADTVRRDQFPQGVEVIGDYFTEDAVAEHNLEGAATVFVARHVLEHVDDIHGFVAAIRKSLGERAWAVLEVPDVASIRRDTVVTNFFHEHLSYFDLTTLTRLMAEHGLHLTRAQWSDAHCGSILAVFATEPCAAPKIDAKLSGPAADDGWGPFAQRAEAYLSGFAEQVRQARSAGSVAGYGAAQRTTMLLGMAGLDEGEIDFFVDANRDYHGLYVPVARRCVRSPEDWIATMPDTTFILARAFENDIVQSNTDYLRRGGVFISTADETFERITAT